MNAFPIPIKTGEYNNRFFDSKVWNDFKYRTGDVVIASYAKAGTTLLQQMVAQLIFNGRADIEVAQLSPWLDAVYPDTQTRLQRVEAQTHRRFLKTHLPAEFVSFSREARYVYVGRDGRDIVWSLHAHQSAVSQEAQTAALQDGTGPPGRLRVLKPPQASKVHYFQEWLEQDGHPFWPFWEGIRSWWQLRHQPNVLLVHYSALQTHRLEQLHRIANFIGTPVDDSRIDAILQHCSFDYMKEHASRYVPMGTGLWKDGGRAFFHSGTGGRWQGELPADLSARYEQRAVAELGQECADWLASGNLAQRPATP